ncbi:MAG: FecR family protein, partial [Actinomycetota bacterium]
MARRSSLLAGLITLVLGSGVVLALTASPATADQFATLHPLGGVVEVQNNGRGTFEAARDGQTLDTGDVLRTGSDGRAEIEYFDGSLTRVDFDTTFELTELSSLPNVPGSKIIDAEQESGNTFNRVVALTGSESRFDIDTPTATASVQGTEYAVKVNPDGTIDFWVIKGAVVAVLENGEREVVGGHRGFTVTPDGDTFGPYILTNEQLSDPWLVFNSCELDGGECPPPEVAGVTIEPLGEKDKEPKSDDEPSPPPPDPPGDTGTP